MAKKKTTWYGRLWRAVANTYSPTKLWREYTVGPRPYGEELLNPKTREGRRAYYYSQAGVNPLVTGGPPIVTKGKGTRAAPRGSQNILNWLRSYPTGRGVVGGGGGGRYYAAPPPPPPPELIPSTWKWDEPTLRASLEAAAKRYYDPLRLETQHWLEEMRRQTRESEGATQRAFDIAKANLTEAYEAARHNKFMQRAAQWLRATPTTDALVMLGKAHERNLAESEAERAARLAQLAAALQEYTKQAGEKMEGYTRAAREYVDARYWDELWKARQLDEQIRQFNNQWLLSRWRGMV